MKHLHQPPWWMRESCQSTANLIPRYVCVQAWLYLEDLGQDGGCEACCVLDDDVVTLILIGNLQLIQELMCGLAYLQPANAMRSSSLSSDQVVALGQAIAGMMISLVMIKLGLWHPSKSHELLIARSDFLPEQSTQKQYRARTTMPEKSWPPSHAPPPGATPCSIRATCTHTWQCSRFEVQQCVVLWPRL